MQKTTKKAVRLGLYELTAFATGFVLMAYELLASRILAPSIGTSTYVWTSVIGVMIAALAAGYAAGGWIADKRAAKSDIVWLLLSCALLVVGTLVFYRDTLSFIEQAIGDSRVQGVVAAILLFMPASFGLGMVSPYLAKLRVESTATTGRSVAGLSAANSLGGIIGTFCTGFILFTFIGARETLAILAGVLIGISWLILFRHRWKLRSVITAALLSLIFVQLTIAPAHGVTEIDTPSAHYQILDTSYRQQPVRVLVTGPQGWQSGVFTDGSKELAFPYTRKIAGIIAAAPQKERIAVLGGGTFTLPAYLAYTYPASKLDVVEIDPKLESIAKKHFGYSAAANITSYGQDARAFLQRTTELYDIVVVDVYNDAAVPFSLTTQEYVEALQRRVHPDGIVIANIIGGLNTACEPFVASLDRSYRNAFATVAYFPLEDQDMQARQNIIGVFSRQSFEWLGVLPGRSDAQPDVRRAYNLTDNHAPVEALWQRCEKL